MRRGQGGASSLWSARQGHMGLRETSGAAEKQTEERIGESRVRGPTGEPGGRCGAGSGVALGLYYG